MAEENETTPKQLIEIPIEEVLKIILKPLRINMGICIVIVLSLFGTSAILGTTSTDKFVTPICNLNTCFISPTVFSVVIGLLTILTIAMFIIVSEFEFNPQLKFALLIISSIILFILLVYITGGILDSPLSSAVGVYVTSYFIVQERKDLKRTNFYVLSIVFLMTFVPYLLYLIRPCEHYLIGWNTDLKTNLLRLFLVILLIGFAGYWGDKVNKDLIKKFNELNNLTNG